MSKKNKETNDKYKAYIHLMANLYFHPKLKIAIGIFYYSPYKYKTLDVQKVSFFEFVKEKVGDREKSTLFLYSRYDNEDEREGSSVFLQDAICFDPREPIVERRQPIGYNLFLDAFNVDSKKTKEDVIINFKQHAEKIKDLISKKEPIVPFDDVDSPLVNIYSRGLPSGEIFELGYSAEVFSVGLNYKLG